MEDEDDREWCSIYGYEAPPEHCCRVAVCFNPYRDGQELKGTLEERFAQAKETILELRTW
jgi:hypothetical protein